MTTTTKKILAVAAVCAIPLGLFAFDKYERHGGHDRSDRYERYDDRGDCNKSSYHRGSHSEHYLMEEDEDDFFFGHEFFLKTGANLVFEGKVQEKPKAGFNGTWKIAGMNVLVDDNTKIFIDNEFKAGDEVNVLAKREAGKITALQIELD